MRNDGSLPFTACTTILKKWKKLNKCELCEGAFYVLYMTVLLVDRFQILLILTAVMFLVLKYPKWAISRPVILFQICLLYIAACCFFKGNIAEAKIYILNILALYSGIVFASFVRRLPIKLIVTFCSIVAALVFLLEMFDIYVNPVARDKDVTLPNLAEIITFHLLATSYLGANLNKSMLMLVSFFSGSKFLVISSMLMSFFRRWYLILLPLISIMLFIVNPGGALDSRLSLYEIFLSRINLLSLSIWKGLPSVNDLVQLEGTIYSFHNIWFDYLWYGGWVGVIASVANFRIICDAFRSAKSELGRGVVMMYFVSNTFGFSGLSGTKFSMMMLGIFLYKINFYQNKTYRCNQNTFNGG